MKKILSLCFALTVCFAAWAAYDGPEYNIVKTVESETFVTCYVHYTSVGADGETATKVSGIVTYPKSLKAKAIIMDNHFTITKDADAPSNSIPEVIKNSLFDMGGTYCFTSADYLGYGLTKDQPHPYLCQQQNAINSIDLMKVARDIYHEKEVKIENDVFVATGYSQGGGVTMAVHREMENDKDLAKELKYAGSFCGAGPYDVKATLLWYLVQPETEEPALIPLVIKGLYEGGYFNHSINSCFRFDATDLLAAIDSKTKSLSELGDMIRTQAGGSSAQMVLSNELLDENGEMYKDLIDAAERNSLLSGWKPSRYPLHVVHYEGDMVVPYVNAENAISALHISKDNYLLAPMANLTTNHSDFAIYYYRYLYLGQLDNMIENAVRPAQGLEEIMSPMMNGVIYNLLGMPVDESYHGIVIVNGQKRIQ